MSYQTVNAVMEDLDQLETDQGEIPTPWHQAIKEANSATCRFRLGAVIVKNGKILSSAPNQKKTHPKWGSGNYKTLHAEGNAIYRAARKGIDLNGSDMYIYRQGNNVSKPCPCCRGLMEEAGIRNVYYSGNQESLETVERRY